MKINFHLNRFEKELHFQLIHINNEFNGLGFFDRENNVCIVNTSHWSHAFEFNEPFYGNNWRSDHRILYLNLHDSMLSIKIIRFISNGDRDFWYKKMLESLEKSFKENTWTIPGE